jgi:hypothetical protein
VSYVLSFEAAEASAALVKAAMDRPRAAVRPTAEKTSLVALRMKFSSNVKSDGIALDI